MPPIRCKYYDDKGKISNKSHLSDRRCSYIHPDNPAWAQARSYQPPRRSDWFPDAWAPDGPRTSSNTDLASTGRVWGQSTEERSTKDSNIQAESSRGSAKNINNSEPSRPENNASASGSSSWTAKEGSTSWADRLAKAAESGVLSTAWGPSSGNDSWGSGEGSWGGGNDTGTSWGKEKATDSGGWGTHASSANPDRPSTSGSFSGGSKGIGGGKAKDKGDVTMRDPSPQLRPPPSTMSTDYTKQKAQRTDLPRLDPDLRSARDRAASFSPAPSTASAVVSKPLPRPFMRSLARAKFSDALQSALSGDEDGKMRTSRSGTSTPTSAPLTKSYKGYEGRLALFDEVVSYMQEAVVFEVILLRAQAEAARWKKTQVSEIYAHPTQKARTILDTHRAHYHNKVSAAKTARDRALKHLAKLPELPTKPDKLIGPQHDKETIQAYTSELKEWFVDLEQHRSLLKAKLEAEEAKSKASNPEHIPDTQSNPHIRVLQSILERERWSWKELKEATSVLESAIEEVQELVYGDSYTTLNEVYFELDVLDEELPPVAVHGGSSNEEAQHMLGRMAANGQSLQTEIDRTTELVTKIGQFQAEIVELRNEKEQMEKICVQAESQFSEYDKLKGSDSAEILELTKQIQSLNLQKRPVAKPSITLAPVKIDELLNHIRPIVVQRVKDDLAQVLLNLTMRCKENQDQLADEIDEMLKPVLAATEQIRQASLPSPGTAP